MKVLLFFLMIAPMAQNVNTYLGPKQQSPGLVRIQVLVNDSPNPAGPQISQVEFDGKSIPLKPRDIHGFRGQAGYQVAPGKYKLKWTVRLDKVYWPRTQSFTQEVVVDPRDLWLQITITGEEANIS